MADTANILGSLAGHFRAEPILAAEFTVGGKRRSATLIITRIDPARGTRTPVIGFDVSGKREARKIAAEHNATCWNF